MFISNDSIHQSTPTYLVSNRVVIYQQQDNMMIDICAMIVRTLTAKQTNLGKERGTSNHRTNRAFNNGITVHRCSLLPLPCSCLLFFSFFNYSLHTSMPAKGIKSSLSWDTLQTVHITTTNHSAKRPVSSRQTIYYHPCTHTHAKHCFYRKRCTRFTVQQTRPHTHICTKTHAHTRSNEYCSQYYNLYILLSSDSETVT